MNITKKERRQRRAVKTRAQIRELKVARLTVHRTPRHIYAQLFDGKGERVLAAASTRAEGCGAGPEGHRQHRGRARAVGRSIAERAKAAGITRVAFDRAGFQYHGRVKALAEAAREAGLEF